MAQALRYPASRYQTEAPPDLGTRAARERLSAPGLKAFFNIAARWKVRDEDARALLGGVTNGPFYEMKRKPDRMLDTDRLTRISYLIGIFKALHILHSRKLADEWMHLPNTQSDLRRRDAARLHDPRRAARHADRAAPARRAPRGMTLPPVALVRQFDTHRLVLSRHLPQSDSVLVAISDDDAHLQAIFELDAATNDRLLASRQRLPGIGVEELVFARSARGRHQRGLLSSASARQPVQRAEPRRLVCRVCARDLAGGSGLSQDGPARGDRPLRRYGHLRRLHGRLQRDVSRPSIRLRARRCGGQVGASRMRAYLDPDSYVESQALAEALLEADSLGVIYPSVRHAGGTCVACFRPALVTNVRRGKTYRFTWDGGPDPTITAGRSSPASRSPGPVRRCPRSRARSYRAGRRPTESSAATSSACDPIGRAPPSRLRHPRRQPPG